MSCGNTGLGQHCISHFSSSYMAWTGISFRYFIIPFYYPMKWFRNMWIICLAHLLPGMFPMRFIDGQFGHIGSMYGIRIAVSSTSHHVINRDKTHHNTCGHRCRPCHMLSHSNLIHHIDNEPALYHLPWFSQQSCKASSSDLGFNTMYLLDVGH